MCLAQLSRPSRAIICFGAQFRLPESNIDVGPIDSHSSLLLDKRFANNNKLPFLLIQALLCFIDISRWIYDCERKFLHKHLWGFSRLWTFRCVAPLSTFSGGFIGVRADVSMRMFLANLHKHQDRAVSCIKAKNHFVKEIRLKFEIDKKNLAILSAHVKSIKEPET